MYIDTMCVEVKALVLLFVMKFHSGMTVTMYTVRCIIEDYSAGATIAFVVFGENCEFFFCSVAVCRCVVH